MLGCVFSATGKNFEVDAFLVASPWREFAEVFHRGEPTNLLFRPVLEASSLQFGVSVSDEDELETQIRESLKFLHEIVRVASFPGVQSLEFRIGLFWWKETICQFHSLPPEFMRLAGELGVSVTLCIYGANENEKSVAQKPEA